MGHKAHTHHNIDFLGKTILTSQMPSSCLTNSILELKAHNIRVRVKLTDADTLRLLQGTEQIKSN